MEETFLKVKSERDELIAKKFVEDSTESGDCKERNDKIAELHTELRNQKKEYEAQFIEYVSIYYLS